MAFTPLALLFSLQQTPVVAQAPAPAPPSVQVVIDESFFRGGRITLGKADCLKSLQEVFAQAGVQVISPNQSLAPAAIQVRVSVRAIHDSKGRLAYQIFGRSSLGRDAGLKENEPGKPQRIWGSSITAARNRLEDGIEELQVTLAQIATMLYRTALNSTGPTGAGGALPVAFKLPALANPIDMKSVAPSPTVKVKTPASIPPYPQTAFERRISGAVKVEMIVGEDGIPLRSFVKEGPIEMHLHALQWIMGYEFEPAMIDGKPAKVRISYTLTYNENTFERFNIR